MDEYRTRTGIAGLDEILNGGLPNGHLFVVEGQPGTGKTTLGMQYLLEGANQGETVMYVTLSESKPELEGFARSHEWSIEKIALFEFTPTEDSLRREDQYSAFHPSEIEFQDTTQSILARVEQIGPQRIVLDSLSELRLLARDSLRYRRQILALKHYFANRRCTVLLLDNKTVEGHDMQLHSIARGVISLERLAREYGVERRRLRIAKLRGSRFREGYHDCQIKTGGVVVYPRLVANEHRQTVPEGVLQSGIAELDALCGGGLPCGSSTLLIGPAGSGKSSLAMQFAVHSARAGQYAAVFVFDEPRQTALARSKGLGSDLPPLIESGHLSVQQVDPAELSPGEFIDGVCRAVTEKHAAVIVIDSLNGFLNAMPGESLLAIQMHELLMYLDQKGVLTILLMAQAGLLGASMKSPVDLSYLSDNVLLTRYFEAQGRVRKAISMVKKRGGQHEKTIRELLLSPGRIEIGEPLSEFHGVMTGVPAFAGAPESLFQNKRQ